MIRMQRVTEDVLPRMKCLRSFRWQRFFRFAVRSGLGLRPRRFHFQEGQIVDRPRPGKFDVSERRIATYSRGKVRIRQHEKDNVPQSRGDNCAARQFVLNPAISEEAFDGGFFAYRPFAEDDANAASDSLMETAPGDIQLRRTARGQTHTSRRGGGGLSRTSKCAEVI